MKDKENTESKRSPDEGEFTVTEADYQEGLEKGWTDDEMLKPGRYKFKRGGFLARHPELKIPEKKRA